MSSPKSFAIGVDMGATTIKAGVVDYAGTILDTEVSDTKAQEGPPAVIRQIARTVQALIDRHPILECAGIGIGAPGVVTVDDGVVHHPPNFVNWSDVDLIEPVRKKFSVPVFVENDANAAAIAEAKYGAGKEFKDFLFVIWGTGVGGGIIVNRSLYRGAFGGAGEIGHVSIDYNGPLCNCGSKGCIESYIGQRYLSQRTRHVLETRTGPPSRIIDLVEGNLDRIEPSVISRAAVEGDRIASDILREAGELLGYALASILNVLDLRIAVIGGGISAAPQFVFDEIANSLRSRILKPHQAGVRVLRAKLGNSAGIIGAASFVM